MGALPKQRISKARQGRRRSQDHLQMVSLTTCPRCGAKRQSHHVCPECGTYNGITVVEPRERNRSSQ
ncbi:MAG: 50S ribosomal protein L32 [Chloroflexota bacterium]|nr:50S ribosomal protein L32 [Chloroflexota bacterium]